MLKASGLDMETCRNCGGSIYFMKEGNFSPMSVWVHMDGKYKCPEEFGHSAEPKDEEPEMFTIIGNLIPMNSDGVIQVPRGGLKWGGHFKGFTDAGKEANL